MEKRKAKMSGPAIVAYLQELLKSEYVHQEYVEKKCDDIRIARGKERIFTLERLISHCSKPV